MEKDIDIDRGRIKKGKMRGEVQGNSHTQQPMKRGQSAKSSRHYHPPRTAQTPGIPILGEKRGAIQRNHNRSKPQKPLGEDRLPVRLSYPRLSGRRALYIGYRT